MKVLRALARAVTLALAGGLLVAAPASAGPTVDPSTLTPPPPPGAECRLDGQWIICQTSLVIDQVNEPIGIVLPCGEIYDTSHDVRNSIRFYNSEGLLVKRFATQQSEGTWSLSPTGEGPTVDLRVNANWWIVLAVPGDESTGALTQHGNEVTISSSGSGVILHIAGLDLPEGDHRGVFRIIEDAQPQVAADLCEALTG
jgi:subtilisin family serine protease